MLTINGRLEVLCHGSRQTPGSNLNECLSSTSSA